jgi:hypothetical protein
MMESASQAGVLTEFLGRLWVYCLQPFNTGVRPVQPAFAFEFCLGQVLLRPPSTLENSLYLGHSCDAL